MNTAYKVEPMSVRDLFSARILIRACFPNIDEYSIKRALCRDRANSAVIRIDGKLVGVINMRLHDKTTESWLSEGVAWINSVAVSEDYRGRGIGRALMQWARYFSENHGQSSISLSVLRGNMNAVHLYQSIGYRLSADGDHQCWTMALSQMAGEKAIRSKFSGLAGWIPERLRLIPLHFIYSSLALYQDHFLSHSSVLKQHAHHPVR